MGSRLLRVGVGLLAASFLAAGAELHALQATPLFTFGQERVLGPNVFTLNSGIGVNSATGEVFVTDIRHIQKFDAAGNFITLWLCPGNCNGVDVNPNTGEIYVARSNTDVVGRYASDGTLIGDFGGPGVGPGKFDRPFDVSVDPTTGNVYVVSNSGVQAFDAAGTFLFQWGSQGSGDGQFSGLSGPWSIVFDPGSRVVYVGDPQADRIQKFDEFGNFILKWENNYYCGCQEPDQMRWIRNISVGPNGNVYVADSDGERISVWTPSGVFIESFQGLHTVAAGTFHPRAIDVNRTTGHVYVGAAYSHRVDHFDATHSFVGTWGAPMRDGDLLSHPEGLAVAPTTGDVFVLDSENVRLKRFSSEGVFLNQWGKHSQLVKWSEPPEGGIGFLQFALESDAAGNVWFFQGFNHYQGDPLTYVAQRFDPLGNFLSGFFPADVQTNTKYGGGAIDEATGDVYLPDADRGRISVFDSTGSPIGEMTELGRPANLALYGGDLFATDSGSHTIKKIDLGSGQVSDEWGGWGTAPGKLRLSSRSGISIDSAGHVLIADTFNHRIQVFDTIGTLLGVIGQQGSALGSLAQPHDVESYEAMDRIYVVERSNFRVQAFNVDFLAGPAACADGLDNDGDGFADFAGADPGCLDALDASETEDGFPCDDGIDNDGDGRIDFDPDAGQGDPGCQVPLSLSEAPACDDDLDNDGDGFVDWDGDPQGLGDGPTLKDPQCTVASKGSESTPSRCGLGFEFAAALGLVTLVRRRLGRRTAWPR
jgi:DNA-binding beta-propeller fold protein YncE